MVIINFLCSDCRNCWIDPHIVPLGQTSTSTTTREKFFQWVNFYVLLFDFEHLSCLLSDFVQQSCKFWFSHLPTQAAILQLVSRVIKSTVKLFLTYNSKVKLFCTFSNFIPTPPPLLLSVCARCSCSAVLHVVHACFRNCPVIALLHSHTIQHFYSWAAHYLCNSSTRWHAVLVTAAFSLLLHRKRAYHLYEKSTSVVAGVALYCVRGS